MSNAVFSLTFFKWCRGKTHFQYVNVKVKIFTLSNDAEPDEIVILFIFLGRSDALDSKIDALLSGNSWRFIATSNTRYKFASLRWRSDDRRIHQTVVTATGRNPKKTHRNI